MKNEKKKDKIIQTLVMLAFPVLVVGFILFASRTPEVSQGSILIRSNESLTDRAVTYYLENTSDDVNPDEVEAVLRNFGCHMEIFIYDKGELVMRLSYSGGRFYQL